MFPAVLLAMISPAAPPIAERAALPEAAQWAAIEACPRLVARGSDESRATGVSIGNKDGYAYVLTAKHAIGELETRQLEFFSRKTYPEPDRTLDGVRVELRLPTPDLALLKVPIGETAVPTIPLAQLGERPKKFPFEAVSVGCTRGFPPTCRAERIDAKRAAKRPGEGMAFFWELASPPVPGRSGGPLLDGRGRVIGICAAGRDGRGYYVHLDEILVGLKEAGFGWLADLDR